MEAGDSGFSFGVWWFRCYKGLIIIIIITIIIIIIRGLKFRASVLKGPWIPGAVASFVQAAVFQFGPDKP